MVKLSQEDQERLNAFLVCVGCGKHPSELVEYSPEFTGEDTPAPQYVQESEGTLNVANGHFLCDPCYLAAGCPAGEYPNRWIAP